MTDSSTQASVDQHLADILARIDPLTPRQCDLLDAQGLVAVDDVTAPMSVPPFDNSAMDGYAVASANLAGAGEQTPVRLPVRGEIHAGPDQGLSVEPGSVLRIMTGAPLPHGADAVVPFEVVEESANVAAFTAPALAGQHVRGAGGDVRRGDRVLAAGDVLGAREIGLLANVGIDRVSVMPRPHVLVMSTGAELVEPGRALEPGTIHDSNSFLLAAAVRTSGATATRVHSPSDDPQTFLAELESHLDGVDAVITTGGVSKGTRDVVKEALSGHALHDVTFRPVAMQPGKPQGFGVLGPRRVPLFTLPGNPVSAYVSFMVFVEPALRALAGRQPVTRPVVDAVLTAPVSSGPGRRQFVRGHASAQGGDLHVEPVGGHGSHLMGNLARSNALIVVAEELTDVAPGETVQVMLLDEEF